jgi:hypothetical protein
MITTEKNPLHIRKGVYRTAGRQYQWLGSHRMAGIGVASMSVLDQHTQAGSEYVYVRLGRAPHVYRVSINAIRDVYRRYQPVQIIRGVRLVVIPIDLLVNVKDTRTPTNQARSSDPPPTNSVEAR